VFFYKCTISTSGVVSLPETFIRSIRRSQNRSTVCEVIFALFARPLDIIFIHIRLRAPLGILNLYTKPARKARVSVEIVYTISFAGYVNLLQLNSLNFSKGLIHESTFQDISVGRLDNRPRSVVRCTALKP